MHVSIWYNVNVCRTYVLTCAPMYLHMRAHMYIHAYVCKYVPVRVPGNSLWPFDVLNDHEHTKIHLQEWFVHMYKHRSLKGPSRTNHARGSTFHILRPKGWIADLISIIIVSSDIPCLNALWSHQTNDHIVKPSCMKKMSLVRWRHLPGATLHGVSKPKL